jgi:serine/threonine protein kinase
MLQESQSSPLETCLDTLPDMSPKQRAKNRLRKQIKLSFFKYGEPLKTTADFYRVGKLLGKGAFGKVNLALHRLCEQLVAVKSVNKQYLEDD